MTKSGHRVPKTGRLGSQAVASFCSRDVIHSCWIETAPQCDTLRHQQSGRRTRGKLGCTCMGKSRWTALSPGTGTLPLSWKPFLQSLTLIYPRYSQWGFYRCVVVCVCCYLKPDRQSPLDMANGPWPSKCLWILRTLFWE